MFIAPKWFDQLSLDQILHTDEDAMRYTLNLVELNLKNGTGGPFASIVVEKSSRRLISAGVNLVQEFNCSVFHAEIVAIINASERVGTFNLGQSESVELFSSAEPCAMCMGAIPWSGVSRVICAATDADVRAIGFDEGAKPANWVNEYQRRGIDVTTGVLRTEAINLLSQFIREGGVLYNPK